jgi:carboxypeptidase PM20D1
MAQLMQQSAVTPDYRRACESLSQAVQFQTVSHEDTTQTDYEPFRAFRNWLSQRYPLVHEHLELTLIAEHTLLFIWEGSNPKLLPVLLTAHQDVVPSGDPAAWTHPPFSGYMDENCIWGRGTLDVKIQIVAILEAVETLLEAGHTPELSLHICFGHDEEIGGYQGAGMAAQYMLERGFSYAMVLDEGGAVTTGMLKGFEYPLAACGTAEKGYMDVELTASAEGGHSSMPGTSTALERVADAALDITRDRFKARLIPPVRRLFKTLASGSRGFQKLILSNLWLTRPMVLHLMGRIPSVDAMIRTTVVPTMAQGSDAANVLPQKATMVLNIRVLPGDSCQAVTEHINRKLRRHPHVGMKILRADEPSKISPSNGEPLSWLFEAISRVFPSALPTPYLMAGSTDAKKYEKLSDHIYRFSPVLLTGEQLSLMHNSDEHIELENVRRAVDFYLSLYTLINNDTESV